MVRLAASDADEAILVRNLTIAYKVSDWFAEKRHLDLWDVRDVLTTMLVTESGGGFIYSNDGEGYREPDSVAHRTPWNWNEQTNKPIGTPEQRAQMRAILRKSLDLPHDKVGSNGRSTGPAQQLSAETGGGWGPMAATMRMDLSCLLFLDAVDWADRSPDYLGKRMANWQTAMLLRVQRPLPSEVAVNYGAAQLTRAQAIARDERFTPVTVTDWWDTLMADQGALDRYADQVAGTVWEKNYDDPNAPDGQTWPTPMRAFIIETNRRVVNIEKHADVLGTVINAGGGDDDNHTVEVILREMNKRLVALTDAVARLEAK